MATSNIKVVCRFRPINKIELANGAGEPVVRFVDTETLKLDSAEVNDAFTFDRVFDMSSRQEDVFNYSIRSTVDDIFQGYNGTVFAYGQTGTGKSFTMMGVDLDQPELRGVIPRILEQIFDNIATASGNVEYTVKVSYMEIYMERIRDLLAPVNDNLPIHEDKTRGVYVKGLLEIYVGCIDEVYQVLSRGGSTRATSTTNMNAESSRSHSIFVVTVTQKNVETGSAKSGQLFLVDLAGSEKVGKTGASGQTLEEAKKINKSLSSLGNVINALTDGKSSHIPYRDSKLTRILQESLGGNSRTTLVVNCSPAAYNEAETLSTLRFGMRAKSIKNKVKVNAELSPAELRQQLRRAKAEAITYQEYSVALERELVIWRGGGQVNIASRVELKANTLPTPNQGSRLDTLRDETESTQTPSRSLTPMPTLEKDEKDEFLRRENELQDQLAERESTISRHEDLIERLGKEIQILKQHDLKVTTEHDKLSAQYSEARLSLERTAFEQKEASITMDSLRDANKDLSEELEEVKRALISAKLSAQFESEITDPDDRALFKAQKIRSMMSNFESITDGSSSMQQLLIELEELDMSDDSRAKLSSKLREAQTSWSQAESNLEDRNMVIDKLTSRRSNLEQKLQTVEGEYKSLLERALEEAGEKDLALLKRDYQEAHQRQRASDQIELQELQHEAKLQLQEIDGLRLTIESLRRSNTADSRTNNVSAGTRSVAQQLAEFDNMKKSLMRDLQTRCERVVELEIALDETREQYNSVLRNTNNRAQQKKMAFLERNLEQLTNVQRQLVEQNSTLKKEVAVAERKLMARNERITNLEILLGDAQDKLSQQNMKFDAQLQAVRERLETARKAPSSLSIFGNARIAKPMRGGTVNSSPVNLLSSPLQSLKAESPTRRSSWFRHT